MALPPYIKLEMCRGDGKTIVLNVVDGLGQPLDLTGSKLWMTMKQAFSSDADDDLAVIAKSNDVGAGITLLPQIGATKGHANVWIDSDDTSSFASEKVKLLYDVQYQEVGSDPVTVARGDLTVFPDVTRRVTLP